jgi:aspartate ammonia-lyase
MSMRHEHDLIGNRDIPRDAYYGVHTLRALENFAITGTSISIYPDLVVALAYVKQAAAPVKTFGKGSCWTSSWLTSFRAGQALPPT